MYSAEKNQLNQKGILHILISFQFCISIVNEVNRAAKELNRDVEKVSLWAWQWKMHFNVDKTEEIVFSCKNLQPSHPHPSLRHELIVTKLEHKCLGVILNFELNFESHIWGASVKVRTGIGLIKHLSKNAFEMCLIRYINSM